MFHRTSYLHQGNSMQINFYSPFPFPFFLFPSNPQSPSQTTKKMKTPRHIVYNFIVVIIYVYGNEK